MAVARKLIISAAVLAGQATAGFLGNGLAVTPQMGWVGPLLTMTLNILQSYLIIAGQLERIWL